MASIIHTLAMLSGESTVPAELLSENQELVKLISQGKPYKELLEFVNENW
jgi:hypothetical protein